LRSGEQRPSSGTGHYEGATTIAVVSVRILSSAANLAETLLVVGNFIAPAVLSVAAISGTRVSGYAL
jgi:hypothetical protein